MAEDISPRAFVCGHPIAHSRSPLIHGEWLRRYGIAGSYDRIDIAPDGFEAFLKTLGEQGLSGGNITIPHKEAAFRLVARRDAAADAIGAVNTVWFEGGRLCGSNTDAYGFAANLDASAPGWDNGRTALVLGAGGAARAIVHALVTRGFTDIRIANRTVERAEVLAGGFAGATAHGLDAVDELATGAELLVNTTSLGMHGETALPINVERLPDRAVVTDIVYVPLETPLLAAARRRGLPVVDGLGMLLHQAVPGFERWFGWKPEVTPELRTLIVADIEG